MSLKSSICKCNPTFLNFRFETSSYTTMLQRTGFTGLLIFMATVLYQGIVFLFRMNQINL